MPILDFGETELSAAVGALDDLIATVRALPLVEGLDLVPAADVSAAVVTRLDALGWGDADDRLALIALACATAPGDARLDERIDALREALADLLGRSRPGAPAGVAALTCAILSPAPLRAALLAARCASPPSDGAPQSPIQDVERRVIELERRLDDLAPSSEAAQHLALDLLGLAPGSTWVFGRLRRRAELLLAEPGLRATHLGTRAWAAAAEMLSMADGNRELADEVASVTMSVQAIEATPASVVGGIRTAWLLLRLDRFEEALEQLERWRRVAADAGLSEHVALTDALEAHLRCSLGPLDAAVSAGRSAASAAAGSATGVARLARGWGSSAVIRAHLLRGDRAAADAMSRSVPEAGLHLDLGEVMLVLARGLLELAHERPSAALISLVRVREHHRRIRVENLAGWPWLEGMVVGLVALQRIGEAARLLAEVEGPVVAWGTPTLLAELQRARALAATSVPHRMRALAEAERLLAESPAAVERMRTVELSRRLSAPGGAALLTPRVREVAELAASGMSNAQIAVQLDIASATVARHMSAALRATGAQNRTELGRRLTAVRHGT